MEIYFNIPISGHAGCKALQGYLANVLPSGADFVDPATFHITLVHLPEGGDVATITPPTALPIFSVGGMDIDIFDTPEAWAVVLRVEKTPQLTALQAMLFYQVLNLGIGVSQHSYSGLWRPHVTLAYVPKNTGWEPGYIDLPETVHFFIERFVLTAEDYQEVEGYSLKQEINGAPVSEMAVVMRGMAVVTEFNGKPPEVPIAGGVDMKSLVAGDDDPTFVTLRVAEVGIQSGNGVLHDMQLLKELHAQILEKRPGGRQGHIPDEKRSTDYTLPVGYWIGAQIVGETLWAKFYAPPGEFRNHILRLKAAGAKIGTSIYGLAEYERDPNPKKPGWKLRNIQLESIDFGEPDRVAAPTLSGIPHVTSEMQQPIDERIESETMTGTGEQKPLDRLDVIRELTTADIRILPETVVAEIRGSVTEVKIVAELRSILGEGDLVAAVRKLHDGQIVAQKAAVDAALVTEIAAQVYPGVTPSGDDDPVVADRALVHELAQIALGEAVDAAKVKAVVSEIVARPYIASRIKSAVMAEMGGRLESGSAGKNPRKGEDKQAGKFFHIPERKTQPEA